MHFANKLNFVAKLIYNLKQMMHCFHLIHKPKNQKVEKQVAIKI